MDVFKDNLPAGWSFGLKPSKLESAIADGGVRLPVALHQSYKVWSVDAPALSATFYPRGSYLGREEGCFSILSCAVPANQKQALRDFAEGIFIPKLIAWMLSIEAMPDDSTIKREAQDFAVDGAPPALSKRPLPLKSKGQRRRKRA